MAGLLSIAFAILGIFFHNVANEVLAVIIGIFGVIKENKLGKTLSVFAIIIGIIGSILLNPSGKTIEKATGQAYSDQKNGFQITPPTGWAINKNPSSGVVAFVDTSAGADSHPAISIHILPSPSNLDDYVNLGITQSQSLSGFSLINKQKFGTGVNSYWLVEDLYKIPSGGDFHSFLLVMQAKDGEYFAVTGQSSDSTWSNYGPIIKKSLITFSRQ